MENKAHALAAGAFVLAVTALLVAMAWWLSRDGGVRDTYELSTSAAVSGLQPQAAVRFKGVPVGKVSAISFDPKLPGNVLIRILVDTSAPVNQSTYATLGYQGVTGIAHIQLDDGGGSKEPLVSFDSDPPRIPLRPGLMGRITDQGAQVLAQVEEASRRINKLLAPENQQALVDALRHAGAAAQGFQQLSADLRTLLAAPAGTPRISVPELMLSTRGTLQSLQATSGETRLAVIEVSQALKRLNEKGGAVEKLAEGVDALAQGAGTLNSTTLPRLHRMSDDAGQAVRQLGRTASSLGENPQSLLYGNGPVPPGPGEAGFAAPAALAR
jgi:phospholipid/cholesterol/gamma-HCH transport system substrate-binding protein